MALALSVAVLLGTAPLRGQKAADAAGQARSVLALASEPWHIIFGLAAMTGLGPGQVLSPSIDDLDLEQRLIFVRRLAWYRHLISPKSARCVATIPLPGSLAELLPNYPEASRAAASLRGAKAHSAEVAAHLADHMGDEPLTDREVEVLRLVMAGNGNCQISNRRFISEETGKAHIEKWMLMNRIQAVPIAAKRRIIQV